MDEAFWERRWSTLRAGDAPSSAGQWTLAGSDVDLGGLIDSLTLPLRTMKELAEEPATGGCYLQHDVRRDLDRALRFAEAEAGAGVRATYFVLPPGSDGATSNYYGRLADGVITHDPALLSGCRRLVELGHDVGLLNNVVELGLAVGADPGELLAREVAALSASGVPVVGTAELRSADSAAHGYRNRWAIARGRRRPKVTRVATSQGTSIEVQARTLSEYGLAFDTAWLPAPDAWISDRRGRLTGVVRGKSWPAESETTGASSADLSSLPEALAGSGAFRVQLHPVKWRERRAPLALSEIGAQADADAHAIYRVVDEKKRAASQRRYGRVEAMLEALLAGGRLTRPTTLLDVGSGAGHWIHYFHSVHGVRLHDVTAVDIAAAALEYVQARFPEVRRVVGSLADPQLDPAGPHDLATAVGVLHHLLTPEALAHALQTLVTASRQVFVYPLHTAEAKARLQHVKNKQFWTGPDYEVALRSSCAARGRELVVEGTGVDAKSALITTGAGTGAVHLLFLPGGFVVPPETPA